MFNQQFKLLFHSPCLITRGQICPRLTRQADPTPRFAIAISSLTLVRHRQVGWYLVQWWNRTDAELRWGMTYHTYPIISCRYFLYQHIIYKQKSVQIYRFNSMCSTARLAGDVTLASGPACGTFASTRTCHIQLGAQKKLWSGMSWGRFKKYPLVI